MTGSQDHREDGFVRLHDGTAVCVPLSLELLTPYVLLEQGDWFEDEIRFVRKLAQPGMKAVDVGANYGLYTLALAGRVGAAGRIWSVEPTSGLMPYLRRSLRRNALDNVEIVQAALADFDGMSQLSVCANNEFNSLLPVARSEAEQVRVTTLDCLHATHGWQDVAFVKIDAEGAEAAIFAGGRTFFAAASPLVMVEIKQGRRIDMAIVDRLREVGYGAYQLMPGLSALAPLSPGDEVDPTRLNMFLCKPDRAQRLSASGFLFAKATTEPPVPEDDRWLDYLEAMPFARAQIAGWRDPAGHASIPGWEQYRLALNAYVQAQRPDIPLADRYACLCRAVAVLRTMARTTATVPRVCTLVRAAADLGMCKLAAEALDALSRLIAPEDIRWLDEPFVPVDRGWDDGEPGHQLTEWVRVSVLEEAERLPVRSSYYRPERSLPMLDRIVALPGHSPRAERRRRLIRCRLGVAADEDPFAAIERAA